MSSLAVIPSAFSIHNAYWYRVRYIHTVYRQSTTTSLTSGQPYSLRSKLATLSPLSDPHQSPARSADIYVVNSWQYLLTPSPVSLPSTDRRFALTPNKLHGKRISLLAIFLSPASNIHPYLAPTRESQSMERQSLAGECMLMWLYQRLCTAAYTWNDISEMLSRKSWSVNGECMPMW